MGNDLNDLLAPVKIEYNSDKKLKMIKKQEKESLDRYLLKEQRDHEQEFLNKLIGSGRIFISY